MAALDKTYYKTAKEYAEAIEFANKHWLIDLVYDYQEWGWVLWNTWDTIDKYLWKHCDVPFIRKRLKEQYWRLWPDKWRILVKWIDDWDSTALVREDILDLDIYTATYIDILRELTWKAYTNEGYDFWEIRQCIKIISITNLSF